MTNDFEYGKEYDIEISKIAPGKSQARQRGISIDDDLVMSIKKQGLIQPIVIFPNKKGDYEFEVVVGQRRLLAHQKLELDTIQAIIRAPPADEYEAKALSLIENVARLDMKRQDYVDACEMFYNKYGTTRAVAEELGLSPKTVRKYLKISRLPKSIQKAVNDKDISIDDALKALDFLGGDEGSVDEKELMEIAKTMKDLSPVTKKEAISIKQHEPDKSNKDAFEEAKNKQTTLLSLEVTDDQTHKIEKYQKREQLSSKEDAAAELVDVGLKASDIE